jgi:DNA polymerase-3 subunit delta
VDFRRKLYLDCKKYAEVIECKKLKPNQIFEWIEDVLKESKKYIESAAMELLIASVGESLNALKNELDKLVNFIGEKNTITIDNVSEIVGIAKEFTIFELIKALGEKDVQRSLMILNRMLELGESPQGMIVMITRFYTQLWRLDELRRQHRSDNEIATEIGVPPYYLKQTYEYFSNYKIVEIEANLRALLTAEVEMKTKSTEPRIVMELLIQSLIEDGARVEQVLGSPFER